MPQIYQHSLLIPEQAIDENGHVNNVEYVRWMQEAAELHAREEGCTQASQLIGATWVVRTHRIEYFQPVFAHEEITVLTWVSNWRRVRSLRKYKFLRNVTGSIVAAGETDWIFIDAQTGRPRAIPQKISELFELLPDNEESLEIEALLREYGRR